MTRAQLKTIARATIPGAKKTTVKDTLLELFLQRAAYDVASRTICLPTRQRFDSVADLVEYDLSSVVADFLVIDKPGLWFKNTATSNYIRLFPRTVKWLDINRTTWRNEPADAPRYYYQNGNNLGMIPAHDTAIVEAFELWYGRKPAAMSNDNHYPFTGTTSQIARLEPLDDAILAYVEWQITKVLNKGQDAFRLKETQYERIVALKKLEINRRKDIVATYKGRFRGESPIC